MKLLANWKFVQVILKFFLKFLHLCWVLNPQPLGYEASALTIILTLQMRLKDLLKFSLNKACSIICKVAICIEFRQFGKKSNDAFMKYPYFHKPLTLSHLSSLYQGTCTSVWCKNVTITSHVANTNTARISINSRTQWMK